MKTIYKYLIAFFAVLLPLLAYGASETSNPYDKVTQGKSTASDKDYIFNIGAGSANPRLRAKASTNKLQFAHDGVTFKDIGSGSGAGGGGVVLNTNTGFEEGLTGWTASGGTFTLETTAANVGFATQAGAWDASAASQTLSNDAVTVPAGLYGKVCSLSFYYKGGDGNISAQVYDGTNVIAQGSVLSAQSTYSAKQVLFFTCPSSGTMQARFIASADAAIIYLDDVKLGQEAAFVGDVKKAHAHVSHDGATCIWGRTNSAYGDPTPDATCNFSTISSNGFPTITTSGGTLPIINFTPTESGTVSLCVTTTGYITNSGVVGAIRVVNESTVELSKAQQFGTGTNFGVPYTLCAQDTVTKGVAKSFRLQSAVGSGSIFMGSTSGSPTETGAEWDISYLTTAQTTEALSIDQSGWRIDANIGGANIDLGTSTISTYTEITDAGLDLVLAPGSAGAEIPCSSTNPSSGLTCSAGSESVGLAFTPPSAGTYEVCSAVIHNANLAATGTAQVNFQLVETPNNAQTILQEGNQRNQSGMDTTSGALNLEFPNYVCGVFTFSDTSKRTIRLMREQVTGGTVNNNRVRADRSTANGQRDIHFKVRRRVEFADVIRIAPPTSYAWSGTHGTDCNWTTTSTTTADPSVDASCTFSQVLNNNFGTVISHSSGGSGNTLPGITFTCPATGFYNVYAQTGYIPSAASNDTFMELTDGTTQIAAYRQYSPSANTPQQVALGGLTSCTVGASVTLRLKGRIDGGTFTMGDGTAGGGNFSKKAIYWNISKAN